MWSHARVKSNLSTHLVQVQLLNVLAEEVDGNGVLPVAAVPPRQLGSGAVPEVLLRRVVERVVLSVPPEIGDDDDDERGGERGLGLSLGEREQR